MNGCQIVYPRTAELPWMLCDYRAAAIKETRRWRRPVTILSLPGAEAFFMPGGNVAVYLPEFKGEGGHFVAGKEVLEILDLDGNLVKRNFWTCMACYSIAGEHKKNRWSGQAISRQHPEICYRRVYTVRCAQCSHEWEITF